LFTALSAAPDVDFGMSDIGTDIILSAPGESVPSTARLSLYLYHLELDPQMRNQPRLARGVGELLDPPQALRAFYLITPLRDPEDQKHLMLGRILQALNDSPFIDTISTGPLDDSFGGGSPELRLSFEQLRLDELSRIWHALGSDYRLSVAFMMRTLIIDTGLDPRRAGRVETTHVAVSEME
jgi:hypothetical protein